MTTIIFSDGHIENIDGKWKATFSDIQPKIDVGDCNEKECNPDCKDFNNECSDCQDFWIDFFTLDEGCYVPMITFRGLVRPPRHIGKLIFVYPEEEK